MYILLPRKYALYQITYVLVSKLFFFFFKCQVTSSSYRNTAGCIHHFFSDLLVFGKEKGNVFIIIVILHKSKAKAKSLNVRPIKPHKHANLAFVFTVLFTFMSMLSLRESGYCFQSLSVISPLHQPGFYFYFDYFLL